MTGARSITDWYRRARGLAAVAEALPRAGQHEQAAVTAEAPILALRFMTDPDQHTQTLSAVAAALAEIGQTSKPPPWPAPSPIQTGKPKWWW